VIFVSFVAFVPERERASVDLRASATQIAKIRQA